MGTMIRPCTERRLRLSSDDTSDSQSSRTPSRSATQDDCETLVDVPRDDLEKGLSIKDLTEKDTIGAKDVDLYISEAKRFQIRHEQHGTPGAIDTAVSILRRVVDAHETPSTQSALATALRARAEGAHDVAGLSEAISAQTRAVHLTNMSDLVSLSKHISFLANAYRVRAEWTNSEDDFKECIRLHHRAVELCEASGEGISQRLTNLAIALQRHYETSGDRNELDRAIDSLKRARELSSAGDKAYPKYLLNLGSCWRSKFESTRDVSCADNAVSCLREALGVVLLTDTQASKYHSNLANSLQSRFEAVGNLSDLDESIDLQRKALALVPAGDAHYHLVVLHNLQNALLIRHSRTGNAADLDEVLKHMASFEGLRDEDPHTPIFLTSIGTVHCQLAFSTQRVAHLRVAIDMHRRALALLPPTSPRVKGVKSSLALELDALGKAENNTTYLDEAAALREQAEITVST